MQKLLAVEVLLASSVRLFGPLLMGFVLAMVVAKEQTSALVAVEQMYAIDVEGQTVALAAAEQCSVLILGAGIA